MQSIINKVQYLSNTINVFRNFLKKKKELSEVILQDRIKLVLDIAGVAIKDNGIKLHLDIEKEPIKIKLVVGELVEVLINLFLSSTFFIKSIKPIAIKPMIKGFWFLDWVSGLLYL